MHYRTIALIVFICLALISSVIIYAEKLRYYLITTDKGVIYKIDRQSGDTWQIYRNQEIKTKSKVYWSQSKVTEEEAIQLAAQQVYLAEDSYNVYRTNDEVIRENVQKLKGDLKYAGWRARKVDEGVFVVSYTITIPDSIEITEQGYYFEVTPHLGIVRYINRDELLVNKYGLNRDNLMSPRFIVIPSIPSFNSKAFEIK